MSATGLTRSCTTDGGHHFQSPKLQPATASAARRSRASQFASARRRLDRRGHDVRPTVRRARVRRARDDHCLCARTTRSTTAADSSPRRRGTNASRRGSCPRLTRRRCEAPSAAIARSGRGDDALLDAMARATKAYFEPNMGKARNELRLMVGKNSQMPRPTKGILHFTQRHRRPLAEDKFFS